MFFKTGQKARSLLTKLPKSRTCEKAGVPDAFCICVGQGWLDIPESAWKTDNLTMKMVSIAIQYFNNQSAIHHSATECEPVIRLENIVRVKRKEFKKSDWVTGRIHHVFFTVSPKSKGNGDHNQIEGLLYERGTGSFEWRGALTGEVEVEHVHRLTAATDQEVLIGKKKAEYCIISDDPPAVTSKLEAARADQRRRDSTSN